MRDWMDDELDNIGKQESDNQNTSSGWLDNAVAGLDFKKNPVQAPDFDREQALASGNDIISDLTRQSKNENMTRSQYQDQIHGPVEQAYANYGSWGRGGKSVQDFKRNLTPEVEFKAEVGRIMRSTQDPAIQERDIRRASSEIRKKMFDEKFAPVQQYYTDRLVQEHDEEKMGSRMMEWTDSWNRGVGSISSATTGVVGAKDWARAYHLATMAPELAPSIDQDWIDKSINLVGETAPYMVATTAASFATGGLATVAGAGTAATAAAFGALGGGVVSFGVEGNSAYQGAIDAGVEEGMARRIGVQVGLINAAIEMVGGSGSKYFRSSVKKGFSNRMKAAGKWTVGRVKVALAEAMEEAGQEASTMIGESQYRKIDGKEVVDRVIMAAGAGFALGGAMDLTIGTATRQGMQKAEETPTIPSKGGVVVPIMAQKARRENIPGDVQPATASNYDTLLDRANKGDAAAIEELNNLTQGIGERESYEVLLDRATAGDEDAVQKIQDREYVGSGKAGSFEELDEGTLAVAGVLRNLGTNEELNISISNEVRTLADQIKEGYETEESAIEMLKAGGLDPNEDPETIRVRGRNFRDTANRVVIELHQGHDAGILLHEAAESYYRGVYGDAENETITNLRKEFEERTGITHDGSDMEWLSDGAVDYAVHNKIHERAGLSVRRMFNKYRKVFKQMLARVRNLRRSIESGSVPQELIDVWERPFKGRGTDTSAKQGGRVAGTFYRGGPMSAMPKGTAADVIENETVELGNKITVAEGIDLSAVPTKNLVWVHPTKEGAAEFGNITEVNISNGQIVAVDSDGGLLINTRPVPITGGQSYKLTGPEGKVKAKFGAGSIKADKLYVSSDGELLNVGGAYKVGKEVLEDHEATAAAVGTTMATLLSGGTMRLFKSGNNFSVETGGKPFSDMQAEKLQQWLSVNFEPTGMMIMGGFGEESVPMEVATMRSEIPSIVRNLQEGMDDTNLLSYSYKLEKEPSSVVTHGQFVEGHLLPEKLGMKEAERRQLMQRATGKSSMKDLNYGEAAQYIEALQVQARLKGIKLSGEQTMGDALAGIVKDHNTLSEEAHDGLEVRGLRALWQGMRKKAGWYFLNQSRIERLLHALNGHEKGMLYNSIYMATKESNEMATVNAQDIMLEFSDFLGSLGQDAKKSLLGDKMFTHIAKPAGFKGLRWRGDLNPTGRISMYMLSKNENGLRHLQLGNGYSDAEVLSIMNWQRKNRPEEIKVAEYMLAHYDKQWEAFAAAHLSATGDVLTKEDSYSPLYIQSVQLGEQEDFLKALIDSSTAGQGIHIGETEDRVRGANQPVQMDAFANFLYNTERVARYTAMAPTIVRVGKLLSHRNFHSTVNAATHGYGGEILNNWLKDSARGYTADSHSMMDKLIRSYRKNSMVYVLGYKIPSALRQTISIFPAMAENPKMIPLVMRGINKAAPGTKGFGQLKAEIYAKSNMMRTRNWDRVEGFINRAKSAAKRLRGGTTLDEKSLAMIKFLDRHTTVYAWNAAYTLASQTMSETDAIKHADTIVERSQPMGSAINLPAFFRGGGLAQLFTTFENQINQNYNYWAHDIIGAKKADKISSATVAYRVLMSYVIPAMLMGVAGRGGLPEDTKDIMVDLATYPIAGFVLFGRWTNAIIKGFGTSGTIIDVPVGEFKKAVDALNQKEPKVGKAAYQAVKGVAAISGKVPQAVFTVGEAVARGIKDPRELIWSPGQLRRRGTKETTTW